MSESKIMDKTRFLNFFILAFSFVMFCMQANIALNNFFYPPVVDSTEKFTIAEIDAPLITICPLDTLNHTIQESFGYIHFQDFLRGIDIENEAIAWGAQHNLTFLEMYGKIVDQKIPRSIEITNDGGERYYSDYESRFYPKYGRCYDLANLTVNGKINIRVQGLHNNVSKGQAEVFITDKKLRTFSTVDTPSHWGTSITIRNGMTSQCMVKVELVSNYDARNPSSCKNYADGEFEKCVDEGLQVKNIY